MPKIRKVKTKCLTKNGMKEYSKAVITIPKIYLRLLKWNHGDEIKFDIDFEDSDNRHIDIKRVIG